MSTNFDSVVSSPETAPAPRRGLELRRTPSIVVGGLPTVSLIPRELKAAARGRSVRRLLIVGVVAAAVVAGGATAGATALAGASQAQLDAANARTQTLSRQLAKFQDVQSLQQSIAVGQAAVKVGSSTEIDWQAQIDAIEAEMPSGYSVTSIQADSASAVQAYPQGSTPLEMPRAASLQMSITTSDITTLPPWLRKLRSLPAYADATASVLSDQASGYTVQLTIHLSPKALVNSKQGTK